MQPRVASASGLSNERVLPARSVALGTSSFLAGCRHSSLGLGRPPQKQPGVLRLCRSRAGRCRWRCGCRYLRLAGPSAGRERGCCGRASARSPRPPPGSALSVGQRLSPAPGASARLAGRAAPLPLGVLKHAAVPGSQEPCPWCEPHALQRPLPSGTCLQCKSTSPNVFFYY